MSSNIQDNQLLICNVCFEPYDQTENLPKLLPCHHTFCVKCIDGLVPYHKKVKCPTCRQDVQLPHGGAVHLQTNFYIMEMEELLQGMSKPKDTNGCQKHSGQPLSFFCATCESLICRDCTILGHKESDGHFVQETDAVKQNYKKRIQDKLTKLREGIQHHEDFLSLLQTEASSLEGAKSMTESEIDKTFDKCCYYIEERRQQLKSKLDDHFSQIRDSLKNKIIDNEMQYNQMKNADDQAMHTIKKGDLQEIIDLATKESLDTMIENLSKADDTTGTEFPQLHLMDIDAMHNLKSDVYRIGNLRDTKCLPSKVEIEADPATAALESKIKISITNCDGRPLPGYNISVEISDLAQDKLMNEVQDLGDGIYEVTYRPQISGQHNCSVLLNKHNLKHSVIQVESNNPVQKFGTEGEGPGQLFRPRHVHSYGLNYYVLDLKKVSVYNRNGQYVKHFHLTSQFKEGVLTGSSDLAIDFVNHELICPEAFIDGSHLFSSRVLILDIDGNPKGYVNCHPEKGGICIGVNSAGHILVSDYRKESLTVYDREGEQINEFKEVKRPGAIAIGPNDDIILCDQDKNSVLVLDRFTRVKYEIGGDGKKKGEFKNPSGVAVDNSGHILIGDGRNHRIQIFKYDGTFVSAIESLGDKLQQPLGISVTNDGHVMVADKLNHCIKKYKYM